MKSRGVGGEGVYSSSLGKTETHRGLLQLVRYCQDKKPNLLPAASSLQPESANQMKTGRIQTKTGSTLQFKEGERWGDISFTKFQVLYLQCIRYCGFGLCSVKFFFCLSRQRVFIWVVHKELVGRIREGRENCLGINCCVTQLAVKGAARVKRCYWGITHHSKSSIIKPSNDIKIYIFLASNMTVTWSVLCLIQGLRICGLQGFFQDNGVWVALLFTGPFLISLQSRVQCGPRGFSLAWPGTLPRPFSCLALHFSLSDK